MKSLDEFKNWVDERLELARKELTTSRFPGNYHVDNAKVSVWQEIKNKLEEL